MKKEALFWAGLSFGCIFGLYVAVSHRQSQESLFNKVNDKKLALEKEADLLKRDINFIVVNQKKIKFLSEKGWFFPKNRLIAGKVIENLQFLVDKVSYRFDPETVTTLKNRFSYKVTQVSFETESLLDTDLYTFIDQLVETFPGILIPRELTLARQQGGPNFMKGRLVFDWFSAGGKKDEK